MRRILGLTAMTALAACSGDDSSSDDPATETDAATSTPGSTSGTDPSTGTSTSGSSSGTSTSTTSTTSTTASTSTTDEPPGSDSSSSGEPLGPAPDPLWVEPFEDADLESRGWTRSLQSCAATPDADLGKDVIQCSFVAGTDPPTGGTDGSNRLLDASVTEFSVRFKQRVDGDVLIGDQVLHGFMMMSDKGVHSPANSYASLYFDPAVDRDYAGEWLLVFQDNRALNCSQGTQVDLFAMTEDRSVGGCQTPAAHHPDEALRPWCWGDACDGGLDSYTGQSGWSLQPSVAHPVVSPGEWVEFTYYVRLNTPGEFDGVGWMAMKRPGDATPVVAIDSEQIMFRAGGWNADMTIDKAFFGPWASSNDYTFTASFADFEFYDVDIRAWINRAD